jgi:hypothetical protein
MLELFDLSLEFADLLLEFRFSILAAFELSLPIGGLSSGVELLETQRFEIDWLRSIGKLSSGNQGHDCCHALCLHQTLDGVQMALENFFTPSHCDPGSSNVYKNISGTVDELACCVSITAIPHAVDTVPFITRSVSERRVLLPRSRFGLRTVSAADNSKGSGRSRLFNVIRVKQ